MALKLFVKAEGRNFLEAGPKYNHKLVYGSASVPRGLEKSDPLL